MNIKHILAMLLLSAAFAAALTGCDGIVSSNSPRIDASSTEALNASMKEVMASLSPEKYAEFKIAYSLVMETASTDAALMMGNPNALMDAIKKNLDGKTVDEVIAMAEAIRNGTNTNYDNAPAPLLPPPPPPLSLQFEQPAPPTSAFFVGGKTPETSLIAGAKPDIAGIRLGEPLNPSLITKLNPAYEINKYRNGEGRESGISAKATNDQIEVMWNEAGIVWHVGRKIYLAEGERFMIDTLKASLLEKYGQPSCVDEHRLLYAYDRQGNFYSNNACNSVPYSDAASLCGWDYGVPKNFKPNCGYKIIVDIYTDRRIEGAVTHYAITTTYVKPIFDELVFKENEEKLAKQRKFEEDTYRAQQNRPQL